MKRREHVNLLKYGHMRKKYTIRGKVRRFPQKGGWHYVLVPKRLTEITKKSKVTAWGLLPIEAELGSSKWKTSLLPMGDGTLFIALKAQVRKREKIELGDTVSLTFCLK